MRNIILVGCYVIVLGHGVVYRWIANMQRQRGSDNRNDEMT